MVILKYTCRIIECDSPCKQCGKIQKFKLHLGCCPEEKGKCVNIPNICIQCGSLLTLNSIIEKEALKEIIEKGDEGPSGPLIIRNNNLP